MKVIRHDSIKKLKKEMRLKVNAEAKDRIHAVVLAMKGHSAADIADRLAYVRSWVNKWVGRYSKEGWAGFWDRPRTGQPKKLTEEQMEEFEKIVRRGPQSKDELSRYRAKDLKNLLKVQFGADYSLSGVKALLHRLGFSSIKPRPRHPGNVPEEMAIWKHEAKDFVKNVKKNTQQRRLNSGSKTKADSGKKES